jgi:hypothetical protein
MLLLGIKAIGPQVMMDLDILKVVMEMIITPKVDRA